MKTYENFVTVSKKVNTPIMEDVTREIYLKGELFKVGDVVVDKNKRTIHEVVNLGTNYVSVVDETGKTSNKWLKDLVLAPTLVEDFNDLRRKRSSSNQVAFLGYKTKNFTEEHYTIFMPMLNKHRNENKFAMLNLIRSTDDLLGEVKNISLDNYNKVQALYEQSERLLIKFDDTNNHKYRTDIMEAILFIELTEELKFSRGNKEHAARVIASTFNVPFKDKLNETISNALDCAVENSKKAQNFTYNKIASRLFNYAKDMGIKVNPEKLKELQND